MLLFIISFLLFPILTTPFLLVPIVRRARYRNIYYIIFILGISIISLRYIPFLTDDGAYHYEAAYRYSTYTNVFTWFIDLMNGELNSTYDYQNFPIYALLLYIFSGSYTYSLISFTVCFITFYLYGTIILDIDKRYRLTKGLFLLSFLGILLLNNYRYTTSGMRYCLAVSIMTYLFYLESKHDFKYGKYLFLYLIPVMIHPAITIYIILRLLIFILRQVTLLKLLITVSIYPFLLYVVPLILGNIGGYGDMIVSKLTVYKENDAFAEFFQTTLTARIYVGIFVSLVYILLYLLFIAKRKDDRFYGFHILTFYMSLLSISMATYQNIIDRHIFLLLPMILVSFLMFLITDIKYAKDTGVYVIIIVILIGLVITGIFYNKNFLELVELTDYTYTRIFTNNLIEYFSDLPVYR